MSPSTREKKGSIEQLKTKVFDLIWDPEISEVTRFKRLIHSLLKIGFMVIRDFIENLVNLEAMALAFKTLLSLAPLLAVIFSILKGFGVHNRMEPALAEALAPLGEKGKEVTAYLIGFVDKMSAGALGSIGLVTLFITVLSLMGTIEQAFNRIWHVKSSRKLTRRFSDYLSVILVGPVLVVAALTITATLQSNAFVQKMISLEPFGTVILTFLKFVPYFTLWGAFTFLYFFSSKHPREAYIRTGGRPGGGGALANRGLGIYRFCCILDSLLRNLLQLRDTSFVSALAARRLGDRAAGGAGSLCPSTLSLL